MGENSGIQWTHHTFNPWVGCQRVSPGCEHCYAEAYDKRVGGGFVEGEKHLRWGPMAPRTKTSPGNWLKPLKWNEMAKASGQRHRVFCASLADVFEDRPDLRPWRFELFDLIRKTPHLDWLLLTKRPENIERLVAELDGDVYAAADIEDDLIDWCERWLDGNPPANVWLGTTVEDQQRANERIPRLLTMPARVRFLSMEPLIEAVDLTKIQTTWKGLNGFPDNPVITAFKQWQSSPRALLRNGVDWVIIGGESGSRARPFEVAWARSLLKQCRAAGVAPFVKQMGSNVVDRNDAGFNGDEDEPGGWCSAEEYGGRIRVEDLDTGYQGAPVRVHLVDHHGGEPLEWPADLRVREFPEPRGVR